MSPTEVTFVVIGALAFLGVNAAFPWGFLYDAPPAAGAKRVAWAGTLPSGRVSLGLKPALSSSLSSPVS